MNKRATAQVIEEYTPMFRFCQSSLDFDATWDALLPSIKNRLAYLNAEESTLAEVKMASRRSVGL